MLTSARKNYLNDSRSRERRGRKEHAVEIGDSIINLARMFRIRVGTCRERVENDRQTSRFDPLRFTD